MFSPLEMKIASYRANQNNTHPSFISRGGLQDIVDELAAAIEDMLPHGSGIDCKWNIRQVDGLKFECDNSFHAMDANGYYCGYVDFTVSFDANTFLADVEVNEDHIKAIMADYDEPESESEESNAPYLDDIGEGIYLSVMSSLEWYLVTHTIKYAVDVMPDYVAKVLRSKLPEISKIDVKV